MDHAKKIRKQSATARPGAGAGVAGAWVAGGWHAGRDRPLSDPLRTCHAQGWPEARGASAAVLGWSGEENSDSAVVPRTWVIFLGNAANTGLPDINEDIWSDTRCGNGMARWRSGPSGHGRVATAQSDSESELLVLSRGPGAMLSGPRLLDRRRVGTPAPLNADLTRAKRVGSGNKAVALCSRPDPSCEVKSTEFN